MVFYSEILNESYVLLILTYRNICTAQATPMHGDMEWANLSAHGLSGSDILFTWYCWDCHSFNGLAIPCTTLQSALWPSFWLRQMDSIKLVNGLDALRYKKVRRHPRLIFPKQSSYQGELLSRTDNPIVLFHQFQYCPKWATLLRSSIP